MSVALVVVAICGVVVAILVLLLARRWRRRAAELERRLDALAPYQQVADVEAYVSARQAGIQQSLAGATADAQRLIGDAQVTASAIVGQAQAEAGQVRAAAVLESDDTRSRAQAAAADLLQRAVVDVERARSAAMAEAETMNSQARERHAHANAALKAATQRQQQIIADAESRAKEIAGEALAAVQDAKAAEETVRALKNVIEGYGDAYLVPSQDLLDELGEAYAFTEAGAQLKAVRTRMRQMVKDGTAAACDYVEEVRRETAVNFVTDAFNGKVATILADVKDDNYGTLAQKIRDAAALVNENGKAFRNARVARAYLDLRLEELKWAVAAQQLRERDREEQRLLKEKIREEERAQRDFEKALKDAEKEEDLLRKAMEKAQGQFDKATDAQKAKYEEQLKELATRLQQAEEKGKRALSMAQQTKSGHVYVISNVGSFGENVFKIGLTRRLEPLDRIKELGDASVPFDFDVHALIPSTDAPALEHALHKQFVRRQVNKVNARKEFFRVGIEDIRRAIEAAGCHASWTMTAECRQYRETLALERAMSDGRVSAEAWGAQQLDEHDRAMADDVETSAAG